MTERKSVWNKELSDFCIIVFFDVKNERKKKKEKKMTRLIANERGELLCTINVHNYVLSINEALFSPQ